MDLSGNMVEDAPRAIEFYREVLALEPDVVYPGGRGADYEVPDGTTFALWDGAGFELPFQPSSGILFAVDDFAAAVAAAKARAIPVLDESETPVCHLAIIEDSANAAVRKRALT